MPLPHPLALAAAAALLAWLSGCAGAQATDGLPRPPLEAASTSAAWPTAAAARLIVERGVEYTRAGDQPLLADVVRPDPPGAARLPAVVYIHGGSWRRGTREQGHELLPQLVATGRYVGVTIGYRFAPAHPWPAQLHDAKAAIRWLRAASERYGVDPGRIAVWGESSGGQIASVLGATGGNAALEGDLPLPQGLRPPATPPSSRVEAVVDFCGPTDMDAFFASAVTPEAVAEMHGRLDPLFGGPPPERADLVRSASAIRHVDARDPPFLLMHGTRDEVVPFRLSAAMHEALSRAGVPSVLVPVADWGHGFRGAEIDRRVLAFLDRHLWGKPVAVSSEPARAERTPE
ncbi:alpha/beta hydrolase [Sorangium sp. So ce269]